MSGRFPANQWVPSSLVSALVLLALPSLAFPAPETTDKLDARLRILLESRNQKASALTDRLETAPSMVDVFVSGDVDESLLRRHGAEPHTVLSEIATARIPAARLLELADSPRVRLIQAAQPVFPLLDKNRIETEVVQLWGASPPNYPVAGYTGAGIIVGIVDTGIDITHLDFKSGNNTRILYIWDQNAGNGSPPPTGYPYGQEWTAAKINNGTCTEVDAGGHGTHVAGVAAGNGRATGNSLPAYRYVGMAPEADIIVVKLGANNDAQLLDGINYIFGKATTLHKDCVVCVAVGKQSGPHDDNDPLNAAINAMSGPGRIVVAAAGNEGKTKIHSRVKPNANQTYATTFSVPTYTVIGSPFIDTEAWFDQGKSITLKVISPGGYTLGPLTMGTNSSMSNSDGWCLVQWTMPATGPRQIYMTVQNPGAGTWRVEVKNTGSQQAPVDFWFTNFLLSQNKVPTWVQAASDSFCVASPASASQAIAAAAYCAKKQWVSQSGQNVSYTNAVLNQIADFSSIGPRRDMLAKPDVAASGYGCASAKAAGTSWPATSIVDDGVHVMLTGTSIAAGVATGAVALLMEEANAQAKPQLHHITPSTAKLTLRTRSNIDSYTGATPNARWGSGKLSVGLAATAVGEEPITGRRTIVLGVPHPNPVRGATRLQLKLEKASISRVQVFDVEGREVRDLQSGPMAQGLHDITWDARDSFGRDVPSGRYYITASILLPEGTGKGGQEEWSRQSQPVTVVR